MTTSTRRLLTLAALGLALIAPGLAAAQEVTIWHDKGDAGIQMIQRIAELYKREKPGVTVKSISMPTDQWLARSIAALNTNTAPDILFNDNDRMIAVQKSTGKLSDLTAVVAGLSAADRANLTAGDLGASTFQGKLIQMPMARVVVGLGVRKSWLAEVGETFPRTWDDFLRIAGKFKEKRKDAYPLALHAGSPGSITAAGIDLFAYGNGAPHALVDEAGNIVIDQPNVAKPLVEYLKLFTEYKYVSPETTNYTFVELYQMIEGGKAGFFRVGNWNVAKWDKQPPAGDYEVGPYPSFGNGTGAMIVSTIRGMGVPENARNKEAALSFVAFLLSKPAQQSALDLMGGAVRSDLDTAGVTPSLRPFLAKDVKLQTDDFLGAVFPWYGKLQEIYYRLLLDAIANPPKDWNAWVKTTADKLRAEVAVLMKN